MEETGAFYKMDGEVLLSGTVINGPTYMLIASERETYTYPVSDWYWFNSEEEAVEFFR
jgi:hypothetical protein